MIIKNHGLPLAITSQLDRILERWALYRHQGPKVGRKIAPEYWELYQRATGRPLSRVAGWELHQFPGCALIGISAKVMVEESWRGKGLGDLTLQIRQELARHLGYSELLATVREDNTAEVRVLYRGGWHRIASLQTSPDNPVFLYRGIL